MAYQASPLYPQPRGAPLGAPRYIHDRFIYIHIRYTYVHLHMHVVYIYHVCSLGLLLLARLDIYMVDSYISYIFIYAFTNTHGTHPQPRVARLGAPRYIYVHIHVYLYTHTLGQATSRLWYIYIYTHAHIYIYIYPHTLGQATKRFWVRYIHIDRYIYLHIYIYIYIFTPREKQRHVFEREIYIYICTYINIYIYSHPRVLTYFCPTQSITYVHFLVARFHVTILLIVHCKYANLMRSIRCSRIRPNGQIPTK